MTRLKSTVAVLAALLLVSRFCAADSIDDAEAKRRGVPVAVVIAERQLETEKAKNAAMERQIADLKKKIADLNGTSGDTAATGPAGTATPVAAAPDGPPIRFDGPRESSPLYDGFVNRYLAGEWETLVADMDAKKKDIAALPAGNAADLTYISRTLAECRPAWWNQIKSGKVTQFRQVVWNKPVLFRYQDGGMGTTVNYADVNGEFVDTIAWPRSNMDAHDLLSLPEAGLNIPGDFGFQQGDGCNWAVWQLLGNGGVLGSVGAEKIKVMPQEQKVTLARYQLFWQNVTAGYYGTPSTRRLTCAMSLASFEAAMSNNANWFGRRPLGSALLIELSVHKQYYQGLEVQTILGLDKISDARSVESMLAKPVMLQFVHNKLTLEQDRRIRDLIKSVALANLKWTESQLTLPEKQAYELDPAKDSPLATERMKIVSKQ